MATVKCTRRGCGKQFDPNSANEADCHHHSGLPVFHEATKSWSCCRETNKPVFSFEDFLAIPGCQTGSHSTDPAHALPSVAPSPNASKPTAQPLQSKAQANGAETYGTLTSSFGATSINPLPPAPAANGPPKPKVEEQDDENVPVPGASKCKRLGCGNEWAGNAGAPRGKGQTDECTYHPGVPIFHEGSKGYSCCKKRTLEFDDFLKLAGCKRGRHLFVGAAKSNEDEEELVECRMDHYQTPGQVIVSVFGRNASKEKSTVTFESQSFTVDLVLPSNKRHVRTFSLFGPIDPSASSYRLIAPKCEITLVKADGRSWPALELGDTSGGNVTFGVTGRTGTVGGKQAVFSEGNQR